MDDIFSTSLDHQRREIRLLKIHSGLPGESLEITLTSVSLSDNPRYNALSYVWGDPSRSSSIILNGCVFGTTKNLEVALQHLRSQMGSSVEALPLWIDAVCIDQSNLRERNEQVGMMGSIFSQACKVLIWLGEGDEYSDELFGYLEDASFLESLEKARTTRERGPNPHEIRAAAIFDGNIDERPWWGRIWVLQELVLAHQDPLVLCGTRRSSWDTMFKCRKLLSNPVADLNSQSWIPPGERPDIPSLPFNWVMSHHWHWAGLREDYQRDGPLPLHDALLAIRDAKATDERDFVYGLLGLMKPEDAHKLVIDYARPPLFIYKSAMEHVWTCGDVSILSEVIPRLSFVSSEAEGWPSWVPKLSEQRLDRWTAFLLDSSISPPGFGSFPTRPQVSLSADKSALLVAGVELDTIGDILDLTALDEIDVETLSCIDNWLLSGRERQQTKKGHLEIPAHMSRPGYGLGCFISGWTPEEISSTMGVEIKEMDQPPGDCLSCDGNASTGINAIRQYWSSIPATHPFRADADGRLCGRKVFLTSQGLSGIATPDVRATDLVVRPFGANCQYVLRPRRSDRSGYTLAGFAYLSESTDPEDWNHHYRDGLINVRIFTIF